MRKPFEGKFMQMHETADDVRSTARSIGRAAESQARLNIALTGIALVALAVAIISVRVQVAQDAERSL